MKHLHLATAALALLASVGVQAATQCPYPSQIKQTPEGLGYAYHAEGGWSGENPMGDEDDIKTFAFTGVKLTDSRVLCDYEAQTSGGVRLSLAASKVPAGGTWKDGFCKSGSNNPAHCTFK